MKPNQLFTGDCREILPKLSAEAFRAQTCITSPPYFGLRDYGYAGQIGLESSVSEYVENLVAVFGMVRDILADDGTLWVNLGDSYSNSKRTSDGLKAKDLMGIPWRVAFALQQDGWYLRQDIVWQKTNPMPESVTDRCVRSHEYLFLLSKKPCYYFDYDAIREPSESFNRPGADRQNSFARTTGKYTHTPIPGQRVTQHRSNRPELTASPLRNRRSVWTVATVASRHNHLAAFPPKLIEPCILAATRPDDIILDPFSGSGTVAETANRLGRRWLGIELNPDFATLHKERTRQLAIGY